jgi:hypothetical protein
MRNHLKPLFFSEGYSAISDPRPDTRYKTGVLRYPKSVVAAACNPGVSVKKSMVNPVKKANKSTR